MSIHRKKITDNGFENLVISDDGVENEAHIVKYFPSQDYIQSLESNIHAPFIGEISIIPLDYKQLTNKSEMNCYTYTQAFCGNGSHGTPAGPGCYNHSDGGAHIRISTTTFCVPSYDSQTIIAPISGGGGGGGGAVTPPNTTLIVTEPVRLFSEKPFVYGLSAEQKAWWDTAETQLKQDITKFLQKNKTQEGNDYAEELITFAILNNNSPEALQEIKNILDILDDGLLGGQPVVVGPDLPITNMAEYLSIFNTSQPATITLYADQPKTGTHNLTSTTERVGHTFISIKQGTKVRSLGFYPQSTAESITPNPFTLDPNDFMSTTGSFGNDQGHKFDVSISKSITAIQLSNIISEIIVIFQNNLPYNLSTMNCTDLGIIIFENATNINIPSAESTRVYWDGQSPGTLGEVLRTITLPAGTTRNIIGGTAPSNSSN